MDRPLSVCERHYAPKHSWLSQISGLANHVDRENKLSRMNNGTRIKFLDGERKRRDIVHFLALHGQASSSVIAKSLETSVESVRAHLKILNDAGTVDRVKNGRVPLWQLKEQASE